MGILNAIKSGVQRVGVKAAEAKAVDGFERYFEPTVRTADMVTAPYSVNTENLELLKRCRGIVATLASINANNCASQPCRLFRVVSESGSAKRGRVVSKSQRRYLASGGAGTKAAEYAESGGEVVEVTEHPVLEVLNRPNPWQSGLAFAQQRFFVREIMGECHTLTVIDEWEGEDRLFLAPIGSQWVRAEMERQTGIVRYHYSRNRERAEVYDAEDIWHQKHMDSPFDPFRGRGPLHDVYLEADVLNANAEFDVEFIRSGQVPALYFKMPDNTSPDQLKEFRAYIERETQGVRGKARRAFVGKSVEVQNIGQTDKDLQSIEKRELAAKTIKQRFGVPESLTDLNDANLASSLSGNAQYARLTLRPRINRDADEMTQDLLPLFDEQPGDYFFAYDNPLPEDQAADVNRLAVAVGAGLMTINEAREEIGQPEIEGGGELRVNGTAIRVLDNPAIPASPFALSVNQTPAPPALPLPNGSTGDAPKEPEPTKTPEIMVRGKTAPEYFDAYEPCPGCGGISTKDDDDDLRQQFGPEFVSALREMRGAVGDFLTDAQEMALAQAIASGSVDLSELDEQFAGLIRPSLEPMIRFGGLQAIEEVSGSDAAFEIVPERALAQLDGYSLNLAGELRAETESQIVGALNRGLREGRTVQDVAADIESAGISNGARAEAIARTELSNAATAGKMEQYAELGIERTHSVTAPGATAVHREIERRSREEPVQIGQPYVRAGETVTGADGSQETFRRTRLAPPFRPNCRCAVRAVRPEE